MTTLSDTAREAQRVWSDTFRGFSPSKKWQILGQAFHTAQSLHAAGYQQSRPQAQPAEVRQHWLTTHYGMCTPIGRFAMGEPSTNLHVLREVLNVLVRLQIPHALGGSMASSLHGIARFTLDADIAADPFPGQIPAFVASFGPAYYVSATAIEDAHRQRGSFNIIHTEVGFKIDVFVRPDEPFEQSAMSRRQTIPIGDPSQAPISVQSAEDVILFKLRWFRLGQETSEQQWKDILGVVSTKAGQLDHDYLRKWADELRVADLLERIRKEAAGPTAS